MFFILFLGILHIKKIQFFLATLIFISLRFTSLQITKIYTDDEFISDEQNGSKLKPFSSLNMAIQNMKKPDDEIIILRKLTIEKKIELNKLTLSISGDEEAGERQILLFQGIGNLEINSVANLRITNLLVQSKGNKANNLFLIKDSLLEMKDCNFIIDRIEENLDSFYILLNGTLILKNTTLSNINLIGKSFILASSPLNNVEQQQIILIENCSFYNIESTVIATSAFILVSDGNYNIILQFNILNNISLEKGFMTLLGSSQKAIILNNEIWEVWTSSSFFYFKLVCEILFMNNICTSFNIIKDEDIVGGGCLLSFINTVSTRIVNLTLKDAFSDITTVGIKVYKDLNLSQSSESSCIYINNSEFKNIRSYYKVNSDSGGALLFRVDTPIILFNSTFQGISLNSSDDTIETVEKIGGPCILSLSKNNNISVINCIFIDNHSRFLSNAILFYGKTLLLKNCLFNNNTPIIEESANLKYLLNYDIEDSALSYHQEPAGAILSFANFLTVESSVFTYNSNYYGGAIMIDCKLDSPFAKIEIRFCVFTNNSGGYSGAGLYLESKFEKLDALIEFSSFESNNALEGGVMSTYVRCQDCHFNIDSCIFLNNKAQSGAVILISKGTATISNSIFFNNKATNKPLSFGYGSSIMILTGFVKSIRNQYLANYALFSGVIFGQGTFQDFQSVYDSNYGVDSSSIVFGIASNIFISKVKFHQEYSGKLACIRISDHGLIIVEFSNFEECFGKKGGVFIISERSLINVTDCNFSQNSGIILAYDNNNLDLNENKTTYFYNSTFLNSFSTNNIGSGYFDIYLTNMLLYNCSFADLNNYIFNLVQAKVWISYVEISNLKCSEEFQGCILKMSEQSVASISNLKAHDVVSFYEGTGIFTEDSTLSLIETGFERIISYTSIASCVYSRNSKIIIFKSEFHKFGGSCFDTYQSDVFLESSNFIQFNKLADSDSLFELDQPNPDSPILANSNYKMIITGCSFFYNMETQIGGAIAILNSLSENIRTYHINIINCNFSLNSAIKEGGAIYIFDSSVGISNCSFHKNRAAFGGAIYFGTTGNTAQLILQNNLFIENFATFEGGAIKVTLIIPELGEESNNFFKNNSAPYGPNIASYPCKLKVTITAHDEFSYDLSSHEALSLSNISSGNKFPYIINVYLLDHNQAVVKSKNGSMLYVDFVSQAECKILNLSDWNRERLHFLSKPAVFNLGMAIIEESIIITNPNSFLYIKLYTEEIYKFHSLILNETETDKNYKGSYYKVLKLDVRECIKGEIYLRDIKICLQCEPGTFSVTLNSTKCDTCPTGAKCSGGASLSPQKGYWKNSENSTRIWFCKEFSDKCLGGEKPKNCAPGYRGNLCSICDNIEGDKKLTKTGFSLCSECPNIIMTAFRIALVVIIFSIVVYFLVQDYYKEANKLNTILNIDINKSLSIYLKIMINYCQLTAIIAGMDLKWPFYAENYLSIQINIGDFLTQIFPAECLVLDLEIQIEPLYLRTMIEVLVPFAMIAMFFVAMIVTNIFKKLYYTTHFQITFLVVNYLLQPTIIKQLSQLITCEYFEDGARVLIAKKDIYCDSDSHLIWVNRFVYPWMAYWALLFPGGCLLYLIKNKVDLDKPTILMKFGFFLEGYKLKYFYWEFYIMFRKITIIIISNLLNISITSKACLITFVCALSSFLTYQKFPFILKSHNNLELRSSISSLFIILSGMTYLLIDDIYEKAFVFLILNVVNFYFYFTWFFAVFCTVYVYIKKKIHTCFPIIKHLQIAWLKVSAASHNIEGKSCFSGVFYREKYIFFKKFLQEFRKTEMEYRARESKVYGSITRKSKALDSNLKNLSKAKTISTKALNFSNLGVHKKVKLNFK